MDVIGFWEVVSAQIFDAATMEMVWKTKEEAASLTDDLSAMIFSTKFDFKEDGTLGMLVKGPEASSVPKDELDAAVEAGEAFVEDGFAYVVRKLAWKEEDGTVLVDSGEKGEVFGETINPWKPVVEEGNTLIVLENYQIVKAGEKPSSVRKKEEKVLTPEELGAVGTYKGLYTKMVGSDEKKEEEFTLELKADGTGRHKRNDLDIKIPNWSVANGEVKLTEKFLGTIDYTGKLDGKSLSLFNGDPSNAMTFEYVYEKV